MEERPDIDEMKRKLKRDRPEPEPDSLDTRLKDDPVPEPESEPGHSGSSRPRPNDNVEENARERDGHADDDWVETYGTFHEVGKDFGKREKDTKKPGPDDEGIETFPREKKEIRKERDFKWPKPRRAHFYLLILVTLLLFVGGLIWYVFSSASDVKHIDVTGNELISDEEIGNRLQFTEGDKMFSANLSRAEENIALLPAVQKVEIEREWWNTVNVTVTEHKAVGYVANENDYYPVLENAQVLRGYPSAPKTAPILHYFEGGEFDHLVESLNAIEPNILQGISEIYYRPSENSSTRIHVFMNDGQEIVADYRTIDEKMDYYLSMQDEIGDPDSGVIDLEIGSSFLPYGSQEALEVKEGIYEAPVQAQYIEDVNEALETVKGALTDMADGEE